MMARLPDAWNQITDDGFPFDRDVRQSAWTNETTGTTITIPMNTVDDRFIVEIFDERGDIIEVNRFFEREDAIAYAREWMRRNPDGQRNISIDGRVRA